MPTLSDGLLTWRDEADTAHFARQLAQRITQHLLPPAASAPGGQLYITLHGDLGAGKTTLARHLLHALGVQGRIKSPTYAVVEPHEAPGLPIWHFDFYRFDDPQEWEDAGFRDIFASPGLKLAEWPQKAAALAPAPDIALYLEAVDDTQRRVRLEPGTPLGQALLQAWPDQPQPSALPPSPQQ